MFKVVSVVALLVAWADVANAQPHGFVGAGFGKSGFNAASIDGPSPSTTYTNDFEDSHVTAFVGEAALFVTRRVALGVEVGLPLGRNTMTQENDYLLGPPYRRISAYREQTFFAIVRGRLNDSNRVAGMWAVGGGPVRQNALERYAHAGPPTFEFGPFGDVTDTTHWSYGISGGAELSVKVWHTLAVVPQFRVLYIPRGDVTSSNEFATFGLDRLTTRIGATVRATF
jgi:hypothetical protein